MSPRLAFAIDAAYRAGISTLSLFRSGTAVEYKEDSSPVTMADRNAERIVRKAIAESYPGEAILGEEEGETGAGLTRWVVDPIDGTKSFVSGVPLYATLVAYEVEGEPVMGVCYFPALDEMLYAEKGQGAFWNGRPCRVSTKTDLSKAVICTGSPTSLRARGRDEGVMKLGEACLATRTWCDAYGHALVATGRVEAMLDPVVARWDISAMAAIVREAGGSFTDFQGGLPLRDEGVSCTPSLLKQVLGAFNG